MPTYEYACRACGHEFELFQQMSEAVKRKCPSCGKLKLQRLIGIGAGVIFKGGGFYETDYRSESYTKAAEADKKAAENGTSSTGEKTEAAKPGTSTESTAPATTEAKPTPKKSKPAAKSDTKKSAKV